ncbi:response regulator [Chitinimonas arctica]|uniref:histidine kinase n=1 Tax=Chitinimonas arctica TaxID=2594795 RepID=A0A516SEH8_9NEIS|nr:response regulator [Chitinimonas arctica]QDQ26569.1 response regulator [Chitinimonas arctica]
MASQATNLFQGVTILIAEDSPTQAEQLRFLLEAHEFVVLLAGNGKDALALATAHRPTLVITDVVMPEMDGYQLCTAIKADPELKETPVVIVTSLAGLQDIARSLECGADNFLRKPYDPAMLISRINYILLNRNLRKSSKVQIGAELYLEGKRHFITAEREQIVDLLVSTYEEAMHMNDELQQQQQALARSNQMLRVLYRVAESLMHALTEAEVCENALQGIMELACFRAGWIYLNDGPAGWRYGGDCNLPAGLPTELLEAGHKLCQMSPKPGEAGVEVALRVCEQLIGTARFNHASVPLLIGEHCLGVVNILIDTTQPADDEDLKVFKAIANEVAIALERVRLVANLALRASQLEAANKELESFSYSVSHDLQAPLRAIDGFAGMLARRADARLEPEDKRLLSVVRENSTTMRQLIQELLAFSRMGNSPINASRVDMTAQAQEVFDSLQAANGEREIVFELAELPKAWGDRTLIRQVWANLIGNAMKYSSRKDHPRIVIDSTAENGENIYRIRDNGAGFDMHYSNRLFGVFQRLHSQEEFPGSGVGLANVQRIVSRHGGRVWAEGWVGEGAVFYFALPTV